MSGLARSSTKSAEIALPVSRLGRSANVTGHIEVEGELIVDGNIKGQVHADRFVLEPGGRLEGDVLATEVRIGGKLEGRIFALHVIIDASADVSARIFHHTLTVARGARVEGRMPWRPVNYFETLDQLPETMP